MKSIALAEALDANSLSGRLLAGDAQVVDWAGGPTRLEEVKKRAQMRRGSQILLSQLVANQVAEQYSNAGLNAPAQLSALAAGAATVTTGHQLQFPGGPAFFHYKILSAIRLARAASTPEAPVVPVFWMASEDHDWEEIATVHTFSGDAIAWETSQSKRAPVGRMKVDAPYREAVRNWAECAGLPDSDTARLMEMATEGRTLSGVVRHWIAEWFGEDIIVLDADDAQLKEAAAELWRAELAGEGIASAVRTRTAELETAGYQAQATVRDINLFHLADSGTERTRVDDPGTLSPSTPAQSWSPNALLRPLYQEFLLPNAAVVLGPSEAAYWLQLGLAFEEKGLSRPVMWIRDSAVVLDEASAKWANALAWKPSLGCWDLEEVDAAWLRMTLSEGNGQEPAGIQGSLDTVEAELKRWAGGVDASLEATAAAAAQRMRKEVAGLQKKVSRALKRESAAERGEALDAMKRIAPAGRIAQERLISALEVAVATGGWQALKEALEKVPNQDVPQYWVVEKAKSRTEK